MPREASLTAYRAALMSGRASMRGKPHGVQGRLVQAGHGHEGKPHGYRAALMSGRACHESKPHGVQGRLDVRQGMP